VLDRHLRLTRKDFPYLPERALEFFGKSQCATTADGAFIGRTVEDFIRSFNLTMSAELGGPASHVVEAILSRLAASGILIRLTASLGGIEVFNTR
jgi:hypothetical protein